MRRANLLLAVAVCGLSTACRTIPLWGSPVSTRGVPPLELYSVEWWQQLVTPEPFEYIPRELASPAADRETHRVVVSTRDGHIRALGAEGKVEWAFQTGGKFNAAPVVHEGVAYVAGGDGFVYALNVRTGALVWKYDAKEELGTSPVVSDGKVLVASLTDTLYALDQKTGQWVWQYRRDTPSGFTIRGASQPTAREGIVYVGFSDGHLVALRIEDGSVRWDRGLSSSGQQFIDVDTPPVLDDAGRIYIASYKDGLFALQADTGDTIWHTVTSGITQLTLAGGTLYAAGDQLLQAVSTVSGELRWSVTLAGKAIRTPVLVRDLLVVPIDDALVFVDPMTGRERVAWDPGQGVSATPLWTGSRLYVLSNLGYLYSLRLTGRSG